MSNAANAAACNAAVMPTTTISILLSAQQCSAAWYTGQQARLSSYIWGGRKDAAVKVS